MKIEIKHKQTGKVIYGTDAVDSLTLAILMAIRAKVSLCDADLRDVDLRGMDLRDADLRGADFRNANLHHASLCSANLRGTDFRYADLNNANLCRADLRGSNLESADLIFADLYEADLFGANLRHAHFNGADLKSANLRAVSLRYADLEGADLRGANLLDADLRDVSLLHGDLKKVVSQRTILSDGDLVVWKKLRDGVVCKLKIPAEAKRVGGLTGRKCRAEFAEVLEGEGSSIRDSLFRYSVGRTVRPDKFDDNPLVECSSGIHFFITKEEAEVYGG